MLTLASGKPVDLDHLRVEDVDFAIFAQHIAKEPRFNGATPDAVYSVGQHSCIGADAILKAGGTEIEAAYFLLHDLREAIWRDDTAPKKKTIAKRIEVNCGVLADDILGVFDDLEDEHDAAIHQAAGLPWPMTPDVKRHVKLMDIIMFVTEWRDVMNNIPHPNWAPYSGVKPLEEKIEPWPWPMARAGWMLRANRLLPSVRGKL